MFTGCPSPINQWFTKKQHFLHLQVSRQETPAWSEGDVCVRCNLHFFWNLRKMVEDVKVGVRQHHCRMCGHVVCDKCSNFRTAFPPMGFEYPVRVCQECYESIQESALTPLAFSAEVKHSVYCLALDESRKQLLSVGSDNLIKVGKRHGACISQRHCVLHCNYYHTRLLQHVFIDSLTDTLCTECKTLCKVQCQSVAVQSRCVQHGSTPFKRVHRIRHWRLVADIDCSYC